MRTKFDSSIQERFQSPTWTNCIDEACQVQTVKEKTNLIMLRCGHFAHKTCLAKTGIDSKSNASLTCPKCQYQVAIEVTVEEIAALKTSLAGVNSYANFIEIVDGIWRAGKVRVEVLNALKDSLGCLAGSQSEYDDLEESGTCLWLNGCFLSTVLTVFMTWVVSKVAFSQEN